jgi:hypothetical protein
MKGLEAFLELTKLDLGKPLRNAGNEEIYKKMSLVKKELKAFDIIKENFDIEAIVIKDYCYIEITSKICVMSKTQIAIKITPENKDKVEALKAVLENAKNI